MHHKIHLNSEDTGEFVLADGQLINFQLSDIDDMALPELIIWFEQNMVANCWLEGLKPGKPISRAAPNAVLMRQIDIPIEKRKG